MLVDFYLFRDEQTGKITSTISLNTLAQPNAMNNLVNLSLNFQKQTNLNLFNVASRAAFVQSVVLPTNSSSNPTQFQSISQILSNTSTQTRKDMIVSRLQGSTGMIFDLTQLFSNGLQQASKVSSTDILQIANGISQRISQRQTAIIAAVKALRSLTEGMTLFNGSGGPGNQSLGNALLHPTLSKSKNIPKTFESMIEDESYDDLGPGSGNRYVIKNRDIISYTINENRPAFTTVEVTGRFGGLLVDQQQNLPADLNVFQSGNALNTATAIDYDLWRMYGLAVPQAIDAPYLTNPNVQCAPYAVSLLNQNRKDILQASLTIVGNEFQQPGEVVYLEDIDLLFYVKSVQHSYASGRGFSTKLELTHGHNLGEYIPTFLDVIGKMLYKNNKQTSNLVHKKQGNVFNQEHIGTIVGNTTTSSSVNGVGSINEDINNAVYGDANRLALQKIIDYAGSSLNVDGAILEIRTYYDSSNSDFSVVNSYTTQLQQEVFNYLTGASDLTTNSFPTASLQTNNQNLSAFVATKQINQKVVNVSANGEFRYPSQKAFFYGRDIASKSSTGSMSPEIDQYNVDSAIYGYIVDCWIVFNNPASQT